MNDPAGLTHAALSRRSALLALSAPWVSGLAAQTRPTSAMSQGRPTIVVALRHAEKADETRDAALSERGRQRAETLAWMLEAVPFDALYASEYRRTRDTLAPLAGRRKLEVRSDIAPEGLAAQIGKAHTGQIVAVCGHSNTVPQLLRTLGADPGVELLESYDDLFIAIVTAGAATALLRMHFAPSRTA
ncbi:MAG: hypothetical protein CHACPFDD_00594 [Phycisphaerae bacterium]|nr:hypothetical protein [Phycisphaerae bacterium]